MFLRVDHPNTLLSWRRRFTSLRELVKRLRARAGFSVLEGVVVIESLPDVRVPGGSSRGVHTALGKHVRVVPRASPHVCVP